MQKLVRIGLYSLFVGILMEVVLLTTPENYQSLYQVVLGPGGLYAHLATAAGLLLGMLVLVKRPEPRRARQRIRRLR